MKAGVASTVITPPVGTMMVGYGNERRSEGIHDDLYAKALVLDDGERKFALICCDLVGLHKLRVHNIRALVRDCIGIRAQDIMVSCTHNHNGPYTWTLDEFAYAGATHEWIDMGYLRALERGVAATAYAAARDLTEVKVGVNHGKVGDISVNRTTSSGYPVDQELGLVRIDDVKGGPIAAILNFSCHPVVLGWDNRLFSADYPGAFTRILEGRLNVRALFTNGACGDINARAHGLHVGEAYGELRSIGAILAEEAEKLMFKAEGTADTKVESASVDVGLPLDLPTYSDAKRKLEEKERTLSRTLKEREDDKDRHTWKVDACMEEVAAAKGLLRLAKDRISAISTEIQALRVADIAIVGIPGELYTEIGLSIKGNSPSKHTFISEVTNDYVGYIPTKDEFRKNSVPSMLGLTSEIPSIIETTALEAIESLHRQ
jgi:neutral ceramidase